MLCAKTSGLLEDLLQLVAVAVEVRHQQLDAAAGHGLVDLPGGLRVQPGAAVGQVVTGDTGHRGVAQAHLAHRLGDAARLVPVVLGRLAGVDLAEVAAPGALVATDEEGGFAVLPAFGDVGTARFLAHGVQPRALHQRFDLVEVGAVVQPRLDPRRLLLDGGLAVAHLQAEELSAFRSDGHATSFAALRGSGRGPGARAGARGPAPYAGLRACRNARSRTQLITRVQVIRDSSPTVRAR